jgi:hypothetical protein
MKNMIRQYTQKEYYPDLDQDPFTEPHIGTSLSPLYLGAS